MGVPGGQDKHLLLLHFSNGWPCQMSYQRSESTEGTTVSLRQGQGYSSWKPPAPSYFRHKTSSEPPQAWGSVSWETRRRPPQGPRAPLF